MNGATNIRLLLRIGIVSNLVIDCFFKIQPHQISIMIFFSKTNQMDDALRWTSTAFGPITNAIRSTRVFA
jgi:hypothetical protein